MSFLPVQPIVLHQKTLESVRQAPVDPEEALGVGAGAGAAAARLHAEEIVEQRADKVVVEEAAAAVRVPDDEAEWEGRRVKSLSRRENVGLKLPTVTLRETWEENCMSLHMREPRTIDSRKHDLKQFRHSNSNLDNAGLTLSTPCMYTLSITFHVPISYLRMGSLSPSALPSSTRLGASLASFVLALSISASSLSMMKAAPAAAFSCTARPARTLSTTAGVPPSSRSSGFCGRHGRIYNLTKQSVACSNA